MFFVGISKVRNADADGFSNVRSGVFFKKIGSFFVKLVIHPTNTVKYFVAPFQIITY